MRARGTVDAPCDGMTAEPVRLTVEGNNGHTATLSYALAERYGWNVEAEIDHRVVTARHCKSWRDVEWMFAWLRMKVQ